MYKKGEATILITVMSIAIVIVTSSIVAYFVLPAIRDVGVSCIDAINSLSFEEMGFGCYIDNLSGERMQSFSIRVSDDSELDGIRFGFERGGGVFTDIYDIRRESSYNFICPLGNSFGAPLSVPEKGQIRTYVSKGDFESVFITPILKSGKVCSAEARREFKFERRCADPDVINEMLSCDLRINCGNGIIDPGEQCDNSSNNGVRCTPPRYGSNCQYCSNRCTIETVVGERCGDRIVNGPEQCEPDVAFTQTCEGLGQGFHGGTLFCNPSSCTFNTAQCTICGNQICEAGENSTNCPRDCFTNVCGNNLIEPPEVCDDGNRITETNCTIYGGSGNFCNANCSSSFTLSCPRCGDGIINGPEQCDGTAFPFGLSCQNFGFISGSLSCSQSCQITTSGCINVFGNGSSQFEDCQFNDVYWSSGSVVAGQNVQLIVEGNGNCNNNRIVKFDIFEDDFPMGISAGDDHITTLQTVFMNNIALDSWISEWSCDGEINLFGIRVCLFGNPEYYFKAHNPDRYSYQSQSNPGLLSVVNEGPFCGDGREICQPGQIEQCTNKLGYSGISTCAGDCRSYGVCIANEYCGDGIVNGPEVCDPPESVCTISGTGSIQTNEMSITGFTLSSGGGSGVCSSNCLSCLATP